MHAQKMTKEEQNYHLLRIYLDRHTTRCSKTGELICTSPSGAEARMRIPGSNQSKLIKHIVYFLNTGIWAKGSITILSDAPNSVDFSKMSLSKRARNIAGLV